MDVSFTLALLQLVACAPPAHTVLSASPRRGDYIARDELDASSFSSAWDAIGYLRPRFLNVQRNGGLPVVVIDNRTVGPLEALQLVPCQDVMDIRYLSASEATTRLGQSGSHGAIILRTRTAQESR